jgi:serpin B
MNWKAISLIGSTSFLLLGYLIVPYALQAQEISQTKKSAPSEIEMTASGAKELDKSLAEQLFLDERLVEANTKFSFKLFWEIWQTDRKQNNIFISPASITLALALTYNGANNETQQEIARTLELEDLNLNEINYGNQALRVILENIDPQVQLKIANSLWAKQGISFQPKFVENNHKFYFTQVKQLDFNNPGAIGIINSWVKDNTNGKIDKIVNKINPNESLFLINAIYFKGSWTKSFDPNLTRSKPFYLADGSQRSHPMMSQTGYYTYYENEQFKAISLPYSEERLRMYIFLPSKDSNLQSFLENLTVENWNEWLSQFDPFTPQLVSLKIPCFKFEYELQLDRMLKNLGITAMFDPAKADFTQMTDDPIYISEVRHKTFIEVNEKGTEAAATTAATATRGKEQQKEMIVDRPFFYVIRDNQTGIILFMGTIVDPK